MTRSSARRHNRNARRVARLLLHFCAVELTAHRIQYGAISETEAQSYALRLHMRSALLFTRIDNEIPVDVNWPLTAELLNRRPTLYVSLDFNKNPAVAILGHPLFPGRRDAR